MLNDLFRIAKYSVIGIIITLITWTVLNAITLSGSGSVLLDWLLAITLLGENPPLIATLLLSGVVGGNYVGFGGAHS